MTKQGFKQVMLSIDTYGKLKNESNKQGISIGKFIERIFERVNLPTLNPTVVGSNPSQPANIYSTERENISSSKLSIYVVRPHLVVR